MTSFPSPIDLEVSGDESLEVEATSSVTVAGRPDIAGAYRIRIEGPARVRFTMQQPRELRLTVLMAGLYWIFYLLERISIAFYVRGALVKRVSRWASAQFMDCYVLGWLVLELVLYGYAPRLTLSVLLTVALYRLVELTQAYANVVVFIACGTMLQRWARTESSRTGGHSLLASSIWPKVQCSTG
jgi:hypothetical protein